MSLQHLVGDIEKPPYTVLFNQKTTARNVWRAVLVMRAVNDELDKCDKSGVTRGELVAVHGNRFVLHHVFQEPQVKGFQNPKITETNLEKMVREAARRVFFEVATAVQNKYATAYPANLFKNAQRCKDLLNKGPASAPGPLFDWTNAQDETVQKPA